MTPNPSDLLTPFETAELLKIKPRTLRNLQRRGILPVIKLSGKIVRYRRSDIDAAMKNLVVGAN